MRHLANSVCDSLSEAMTRPLATCIPNAYQLQLPVMKVRATR